MRLFDMSGKVVLITGSTRGIGLGIAEAMIEAGAKVVISSRKLETCESVVNDLIAKGGDALPVACNVSHEEELGVLVSTVLKKWGRVDSLICNAAVNPYFGDFLDTPDDAFHKTIQVNILSNMRLAKLVVPQMVERKDGSIIVVSSIAAFKGNDKLGLYGLTKAADIQLVRNLAVSYGRENIRANAIAPAVVRTDFAKALYQDPDRARRVADTYALGRLGEVDDIAGAAVFLASRAGAWITGQTIIIDGGWQIYGEVAN